MSVVLSISSHVVRGTVGASLAGFVLQRIGHKVWTVPTVVWDHHPGFGRPSGLIPTGEQMASLLADLRAPEQAVRTDMILTGYFANEGQIEAVADHVRALRDAGHSMCFVCDPVCGDAPGPYVPMDVLMELHDTLVPLADILTPNRHELGFLSGLPVTSNIEIVTAARALGRPMTLVTSAFSSRADHIANVLVAPDAVWRCETYLHDAVPSGTGDLMTALFAGWIAAGIEPPVALGRAAAGVQCAIVATLKLGCDELAIVEAQRHFGDSAMTMGVHKLLPDGRASHGK